ncbi:MAG: AAA family ATPase [Gordonia sp. (in: high G+C Gram-positive bacteria)]|uniref:AAA family ATPase n=1 Tax=Gordonia sp. (in: high G+C Gram-positive bacteria) TaxID=84139 RepID=UPI0039E4227C
MSTALVIGKFYPPHDGHVALIEHAARGSGGERGVTVLVMATREESLSLGERVAWLAESCAGWPGVTVVGVHDDAPVDYRSPVAWTAHVALIAAALRAHGQPMPDVVVTSEDYGHRLAEELGARCEVFDPERTRFRVSGTAVRADVAGRWAQLPAPVRRGLAVRTVVLGAESTGTSTLAADLVRHYRGRPGHARLREVLEYGREFTYRLHEEACTEAQAAGRPAPGVEDLVWRTEHFAHIAVEQSRREDEAALAHPLVIADTDAFATALWERRYVGPDSRGAASAGVPAASERRLYLVTDHVGVPFEQDGWRDGEHLRAEMHRWFVDGLTEAGHSWVLLRGSRAERFHYAVRTVDALWRRGSAFASPEWADSTVLA